MKQSVCIFLLTLLWGTDVSAQDPNSILQKEQIRRQEIVLSATKQMEQAAKLLNEGKREEAREVVLSVLDRVPDSGKGKAVHDQAKGLLALIDLNQAQQLREKGDLFAARDLAVSLLEVDPSNEQAKGLIASINEELGVDREGNLNPAVDQKFVQDLKSVNDNYETAKELFETGQYDAAAATLGEVLQIDPYNLRAAELLRKINLKRKSVAEKDRELIRKQMLLVVSENWTNELRLGENLEEEAAEVTPINRSNEFAIQEKLRTIIIPQVDFVDASIQDAIRFLTAKTRELDPEGTGVSFLLKNEQVLEQSARFSLSLNNIPADEVLRYATNLAGVKSKIEEFAVFIVPLSDRSDVLVTRDFPVRATFFDVEREGQEDEDVRTRRRRAPTTTTRDNERDNIRAALEFRGVSFPEGSTAIYNNATGILTVKNTQDQIDLIEELVTEDQGDSLMVRVETKFIEINQEDLEELTPQFNLQGSYAAGFAGNNLGISAGSATFSNGLQGAANIQEADGINRIIEVNQVDSVLDPPAATLQRNQVGITGALDGNQFATLINLINQKSSSDIMTAPSIIINDGAQGEIIVAREFDFPIEFDEPEQVTGTGIDLVTVVQPAFPTDFEERDVGVSLTVKPQISVDRQRVFVTLRPELTEFDGFVDYGSPINDPNVTASEQLISLNEIKLPVFSTRTVENAQMEISDGFTMVLGGLIREDISTVDEKVPFLGDLPLLGRAFRSKAEQSIKRNLLIFVSVRILRPDGEPYNLGVESSDLAALPGN